MFILKEKEGGGGPGSVGRRKVTDQIVHCQMSICWERIRYNVSSSKAM